MNKSKYVEWIGWYGAAAILFAHALNSFQVIGSSSLSYQVLSLSGAIGITIVSLAKGAKQPAVLNIVWAYDDSRDHLWRCINTASWFVLRFCHHPFSNFVDWR